VHDPDVRAFVIMDEATADLHLWRQRHLETLAAEPAATAAATESQPSSENGHEQGFNVPDYDLDKATVFDFVLEAREEPATACPNSDSDAISGRGRIPHGPEHPVATAGSLYQPISPHGQERRQPLLMR
jgi:hypothetical protein